MKFAKYLNQIICPKPTHIRSDQKIITNRDVLGRILHLYQNKNLSFNNCIAEVLNEINHNQYKIYKELNIIREMKKIYTAYVQCKKLGYIDYKKMPQCFNKLKLKLDRPFTAKKSKYENKLNDSGYVED